MHDARLTGFNPRHRRARAQCIQHVLARLGLEVIFKRHPGYLADTRGLQIAEVKCDVARLTHFSAEVLDNGRAPIGRHAIFDRRYISAGAPQAFKCRHIGLRNRVRQTLHGFNRCRIRS